MVVTKTLYKKPVTGVEFNDIKVGSFFHHNGNVFVRVSGSRGMVVHIQAGHTGYEVGDSIGFCYDDRVDPIKGALFS